MHACTTRGSPAVSTVYSWAKNHLDSLSTGSGKKADGFLFGSQCACLTDMYGLDWNKARARDLSDDFLLEWIEFVRYPKKGLFS